MAENGSHSAQLALPDSSNDQNTTEDLPRSSAVKLDQLGPAIVNSDGTLSRIQNWDSMTQTERDRTLKILSKRNLLRQDKLKELDAESSASGSS